MHQQKVYNEAKENNKKREYQAAPLTNNTLSSNKLTCTSKYFELYQEYYNTSNTTYASFTQLRNQRQYISAVLLQKANLICCASNALVASSCDSNCTNAKFLLILTFDILPYGSKCLSRSLVLVRIGSKLMTNRVFEGLGLADDLLGLPPGLLIPRSCCITTISWIHSMQNNNLLKT